MTHQPSSSFISACAVAALLCTAVSSHAGSVIYSDPDFGGAWRTETFSSAAGASVTQTIDTASINSSTPSGDFIGINVETGQQGLNVEGFTFDPVMQINPFYTTTGIGDIDFSADVYTDNQVDFLFAIEQGGTHYFGIQPSSNVGRLGTGWVTRTGTLSQDEFWRFNDTLGSGGQHPDFSTAGAPITVGVYSQLGASAQALISQQQTGTVSFDNFSAEINYAVTVPEPGVFSFIGLSSLLCILRRRRVTALRN